MNRRNSLIAFIGFITGMKAVEYKLPEAEAATPAQQKPSMKPEPKTCKDCVFFGLYPDSDHGQCRRFPPKSFSCGSATWVEVGALDFCGEMKIRDPDGGYGEVQFGVKLPA